jgi:hypothetical protein
VRRQVGGGQAQQVAEDYVAALHDKDEERACELQTASSREHPAAGSCDLHAHKQLVPPPEVQSVDRNGDRARVLITGPKSSVTVELKKENGDWKVEEYQGQLPQ